MKSILLYLAREILIRLAGKFLQWAKVEDHWLVSAGRAVWADSEEDVRRILSTDDSASYEIASALGATRHSQWDKVRDRYLSKNPKCAACGNKKDLQVHHIKPFHLFPKEELNENNLITLCNAPWRRCHFIFGHSNYWAAYNPHVEEDAEIHRRRILERLTA